MQQLSQSRSEAAGRTQRAEILLRYHTGETVSAIRAALRTNQDESSAVLPRRSNWAYARRCRTCRAEADGPALSTEARAWVVSHACQKPQELFYTQELWTTRLLA